MIYVNKLLIAGLVAISSIGAAHAQRLVAYGDSITAGLGLTPAQMYANELGAALNLPVVNRAVNGDMAGDASMDTLAFQPLPTDTVTIMLGTNDERIYGVSAPLQEISMEAMRDVALIATAPTRTVAAQMTLGGAWATNPPFFGEYTDNAGSTAETSACGTTVWVGYVATEWVNGHAQATVTIDGVVVDTIHGDAGGIALETQNNVAANTGVMWFPAAKRYGGLSSGCHAVSIATTVAGQRFYLEWIAGSAQPAGAKVFISDVIAIGAACTPAPCGSPANVASYGAMDAALVAELVSDGRNATLVGNTANVIMPTDYQADVLHPNAAGDLVIKADFLAAISPPPPPPAWAWSATSLWAGVPSGGGATVYCVSPTAPVGACATPLTVP